VLRWLVIAAALGCGHPAQPVGPATGTPHADAGPGDAAIALDDDLPQLAARSLALYQDLAKVLGGPAVECAAATTKLDAIATQYAEVTAANDRVLKAGHDKIKRLKAALEPHEADFDAAAKTIVESQTMRNCSQDPAFAKVMDRLVGEQ
jgi:hypothetical protein